MKHISATSRLSSLTSAGANSIKSNTQHVHENVPGSWMEKLFKFASELLKQLKDFKKEELLVAS